MALLKHLLAILLLPFTVVIIVPVLILARSHSLNIGWSLSPPLNLLPSLAGLLLVFSGLVLMVKTIALFATVGQGTLAPWTPPTQLVVRGVYQHVRNPMITGVLCILMGEAVISGSRPLLTWFILFLVVNLIYIPLLEEPQLERRFGEAYRQYQQHVPRWIPRWKPWSGPNSI